MKVDEFSNPKLSQSLITSVELLFAVIIGVTFFNFYEELVPLKFDFFAVMIIVTFITVIADMIGFLRSINKRPYTKFPRYILDLIILYLYFQLLYSPLVSLEFFFKVYLLIFGAYLIWVWLEYREYKDDEQYKKEDPTRIRYIRKASCLAISFAIWIYYSLFYTEQIGPPYESASIMDWFLLYSTLAMVIGIWFISWLKGQFVDNGNSE